MKKDLKYLFILLVLTCVVFNGVILNPNYVFSNSGDNATGYAVTRQVEKNEGNWNPYIFGGMPWISYIHLPYNHNYLMSALHFIAPFLFLGSKMGWLIIHYLLLAIGMYFLAKEFGLSQRGGLVASLVVLLNPFILGFAMAGHGNKMHVLAYIPLLFLFVMRFLREGKILNFALISVFAGSIFMGGHPQIAVYGLFLVGGYCVYKLKEWRRSSLVIIALALGFSLYMYQYLPFNHYAQFSMRGGGLGYDYATMWSFPIEETLTFIAPNAFGWGGSTYTGSMPFTEIPAYMGFVPIVLCFFAGWNKQTKFLITFSILVILLSWGKYFPLYDLLYGFVPYFNKFRAPQMILTILPITLGLLAGKGLRDE